MTRRTLVIGAGWLGAPLAGLLAGTGRSVWAMRRSAGPPGDHRVTSVVGDVATAARDPHVRARLPASVDEIVLCTAPSRHRGETHDTSYPRASAGAAALADALGATLLLYTSSTGVYGVTDGRVVDESEPVARGAPRIDALIDAEQAVLDAPVPHAAVLRVAGLYGPGRDPADRFRDPAILRNGNWWCNFAWRDDVAGAVLHLLERLPLAAAADARSASVFNCADGRPVLASAIVRALTGTDVHRPALATDPSSRSNQRIDIGALRRTGWQPTVPSVFDGLRQLGHPLPATAPSDDA